MNRTNILNRLHRSKSTVIQFVRYLFVGGGATIVQWGLLVLFKEVFGLNANAANMVGFAGGLIFNYIISTLWVFDNSAVKNKAAEFTVFALIGIVGLGINQGLIWLFDKPIANKKVFGAFLPSDKYYLVGQVSATALAFFWNFFARKYLLYSGAKNNKIKLKEEKESLHIK